MPDLTPSATPLPPPIPSVPPGAPEMVEPEIVVPKTADVGNMMFEDFFPPLSLNEPQKESLAQWFTRDLKACVNNVNKMKSKWATWRAVYALEYVKKFYPTTGLGADFASGLLCEKMLEGLDRIPRAILSARPFFMVDDKTSNTEDIEYIHRAEWFMHTLFEDVLDIQEVLSLAAFFDFLLDGSMILEGDQMYEKIPQRNIKTYASVEDLIADESKILDSSELNAAIDKVSRGEFARVLIEEDILTKNGLQLFLVDKVDHLIPPNVYSDRDIRFRARRMYLTESDLRLLASEGVGWYKQADVDKVLGARNERRIGHRFIRTGEDKGSEYAAKEEIYRSQSGELAYDWRSEDDRLDPNQEILPYKNTFAVYRIICKYGYKTGSDTKGLIPKYCTFDYESESQTILRARTYPHFTEKKNYFHFKLGHMPKSYWGFGYGARLIDDDFIQSNAIDLYLDGAAIATFRPFISVHPEVSNTGGHVPFRDGLGPGKIGFVGAIGEFQQFDLAPPPLALVQQIVPLVNTRAENKTNMTSLVQGRTESSDPRSPARKAQLLLREAWVGINAQIKDWNRTGWNPLADFVWETCYENLVYQGEEAFEDLIVFPGIAPEIEKTNRISADELSKKIKWKSQASADLLNADLRTATFLQHFQFFTPLIQQLAALNPDLFKKYFIRWMRWAAQEMEVRGFRYLVPAPEELGDIPAEQLSKIWDALITQIRAGQLQEPAGTPMRGIGVGGMEEGTRGRRTE